MIEQVIILGNHIQGLGISRIANRLGCRVYLFNQSHMSVARFSNTLYKFIKFRDIKHLHELLTELDLENKKTVIFPTNDQMVGFLAENFNVLSEKFLLSISEKKITDIAFNKRNTYKAAEIAGIPYPLSYYPDSYDELLSLEPRFKYPLIIKPAIMFNFYKKAGKKVFYCDSKETLISNYKKAIGFIPPDEVIIQEMLPGGAPNLFSFASYASQGKVKGSFIANRLRQKPMDFGVATTFAKSVLSERIDTLARKFLQHINYTGLSEVEFMYDERIQDYKLIEINPRTWKWHTMSNKIGINLIKMLLDDLEGKEIKEASNQLENIGWIEQLTDTFVMISEVIKGKMKFKEYRKSLRIEKEFATWDRKDPLPAIMYILLSPYFYFTR